MRKLLLFFFCIAATFGVNAQRQEGYVRTLEKANHPSHGIEGVTINILEYPNALVSKKGGKFSFTIQGKKPGDPFKVSRVTKKGYSLVDKRLQGRMYSYSATAPIEIVMVSDKQLAAEKKLIEDKAYARAKKTYEAGIANLERELNEKRISEQAYYAERERLNSDYDNYIQLINDMAERYAIADYKNLSDANREILECIENGLLERADSLINNKGDFDKREQELRSQMELNRATAVFLEQSQRDAVFKLNDLAQDYYNKYTIFASNHQNDSAAFYIQRRAALDSTNVEWQSDAGYYIQNLLADFDLALKYYEKGLRQAIAQYGEQSDWVAWFYNDIGLNYEYQGDDAQAMEYYQKSLAIGEQVFGSEHQTVADAYDNMGLILLRQKDYSKAFEYFQKSLAIREQVFGTEHQTIADSYHNMGLYYDDIRDFARALSCFQKALAIRERILGTNAPEVAQTCNGIAGVYYKQGDYAHAMEYSQKSLAIRKLFFGTWHPEIAVSYQNIGRLYYKMEDYVNALEYTTKANNIYLKTFGPDHEESQKTTMMISYLKALAGE